LLKQEVAEMEAARKNSIRDTHEKIVQSRVE